MKVLFVTVPVKGDGGRTLPSCYPWHLAAVAGTGGFDAEVFDTGDPRSSLEGLLIKAGRSGLVFVEGGSWIASQGGIAPALKREHPRLGVACLAQSFCMDDGGEMIPGVDYVIEGDPEKPLLLLLNALKKGAAGNVDVPGVSAVRNGVLVRVDGGKCLTDEEMERLPFPPFHQVPCGVYDDLPMETSRGMPFFSPFDSSPFGSTWRFMSAQGIYERYYRYREQCFSRLRSPSPRIVVIDRCFTCKPRRMFDLSRICKRRGVRIPLIYRSRCSDILEEGLAGVLEPFTQEIILEPGAGYASGLARLKKGYVLDVIGEAARLLKNSGMGGKARFVFKTGFPWETPAQAAQTRDFAARLEERYGVRCQVKPMKIEASSR